MRRTLEQRALLCGARRVLVACSGGPDSTALLHVLHALRAEHGCELQVASVDHGLRASAAHDVACAGRAAAHLGVGFFPLKVAVEAGASVQARARDARYRALLACAADIGAERVAVGHTQEDQAETVVARLLRGTGVSGLAGISPRRDDGVIRPLIDCPRADVQAYVRALGVEVARDPSNDDPRYGRVRIRQQLLPMLQREQPGLVPRLCALADEARDTRAFVAAECARQVGTGCPNARQLREVPGPLRRLALKAWFQRELGTALLRNHLDALDRMLEVGGEVRLPGDWAATLDGDLNVILRPNPKRGRGSVRPTEGGQI